MKSEGKKTYVENEVIIKLLSIRQIEEILDSFYDLLDSNIVS
ncbi:hypothetical protein [Orenia metallireducens]|nr:hypothetical protein [Orenia metallireducens]